MVVTAGVGDATAVVLETLLQPGDRVLVEHPTYPGALGMVDAAGGRCTPGAGRQPATPTPWCARPIWSRGRAAPGSPS